MKSTNFSEKDLSTENQPKLRIIVEESVLTNFSTNKH